MVLAETPVLFEPGELAELFVGFLILVAVFAAACIAVVGGGVLAFRAGRGSRGDLWPWLVLAVLALITGLAMVPDVLEGDLVPPFAFISAMLAGHVMLYLGARATSRRRRDRNR